ncbi:unnamed protein product [Rotaria sp. Silwood1]|nr:unnamed protein product [Rotaria sp. Silwood1]CAF3660362.1 unnamed protein product [Rotaria sp. Silwood1]CAF4598579.1 unnamed protein product [Rotaria sp. Silwood1]
MIFYLSLPIDVQPRDSLMHLAEYTKFALDNKSQNYKLQISQFHSNISTASDLISPSWNILLHCIIQ